MKKLRSIFVSLALLALAASSCEKVHEFPKQGREVDPTDIGTKIDISCRVQIPLYDIITKAVFTDPKSMADVSKYDRRYIVNIYENEYADTLVESHIVTREVPDTSDLVIETKLHARKYKLVVWMDYVTKGSTDDLYYNTSNGKALNAVHQPVVAKYTAGSDYKDAQSFFTDLDLTTYSGQWYADVVIPAPLARPVAKITFLANDLAEYASTIGYEGPLSELAEDINLELSYDGYYPTGFNAHTGKLNDSEPGYGFKSVASYPYRLEGKDYTRIAFDYVFVNNERSSVTISARFKNREGKVINEVYGIVVPVERGKETVIIYKFLTKESVPGIGIDPGFDGEFDIYV